MFLKFGRFYQNAAGEGGDAGAGGASDSGSGDAGAEGSGTTGAAGAEGGAGTSGQPGGMTDKERELLAESMKRKEKIKELETKLNEASNALKPWEGLNPEDIRKLVQERREQELKQMEKKGEFDKIRQQILEAHEAEKKTLAQKIEELSSQINSNLNQIDHLTVGQAFAASKFINEELVLTPTKARTIYGAHFERDASGNVIGYDKPVGNGDRAPLVDGQGNPLSFDQALQKIVQADPDRDSLIKAKLKQGADSGTTGAKGNKDDVAPQNGVSRIADALRAGGLKKFSRV